VGRVEYSSFEGDDAASMAAGNFVGIATMRQLAAAQPEARVFLHSGTLVGVQPNGERFTPRFRTLGYHESHSMPWAVALNMYSELAGAVDADQATRIWAWGGMVGVNGLELSQKARGIGNPTLPHVGPRVTEGKKPMGWIKLDESDVFRIPKDSLPHSVRIERRVIDGNFSRWAKWMTAAMGSLTLRFAEHRQMFKEDPLRVLPFDNPVATLKATSLDLAMKRAYLTRQGKTRTAIETQELIANYGNELRQGVEIPADEYAAVDELINICGRLSRCNLPEGDTSPIMRYVDFAPRMTYLAKEGFAPDQIRSDNRKALDANFSWNRIQPSGPGMNYWASVYKKGKAPDPVGDELIAAHMATPYPGTRAVLRGTVVLDPRLRKITTRMDWHYIEIGGKVLWLDSFDNDVSVLPSANGASKHRRR
jgi:hypothetical protein